MSEILKRRASDTRVGRPSLPLSDQLLEAGLNASGMPAILFSPEDEITYMSDVYREMFNVPPEVETFSELVKYWGENNCGPQMFGGSEAWLDRMNQERRKMRHRIYELNLCDGRWFLVNETVVAGSWLWNFLTEITSFKAAEQELAMSRDLARQDAETDPLTGIFNRRAAVQALESKIQRCKKSELPLSVALIDLDHFKSINDTHGHDAGDEVLCHFTVTASWLLRRSDMFARFGGEEFILIMPGAQIKDAAAIVERIRKEVASSPLLKPDIPYTFSAGIVGCECDNAQSLIKRADNALYKAKDNGRNRSEIG